MQNMNNRLQELNEVMELALKHDRRDILESCQDELKELNVLIMENEYTKFTPKDQILTNQIQNLISYFGRDKTEAMFKIIFSRSSK